MRSASGAGHEEVSRGHLSRGFHQQDFVPSDFSCRKHGEHKREPDAAELRSGLRRRCHKQVLLHPLAGGSGAQVTFAWSRCWEWSFPAFRRSDEVLLQQLLSRLYKNG